MTEPAARAALVDAAEELFAVDGIERASLRGVMRLAGTDPGAIHYHFGGREALAAEVLDRTLVPLNDHRLALLRSLQSSTESSPESSSPESSSPVPLHLLVDALIRPDVVAAFDLEARGRGRSRLIGAIYLHPSAFVERQVEERFAPVAQRFVPHLGAALPDIPPELLSWRVRWCLFGTVGALLSSRRPPFDELGVDELIARLVTTLSAALAASHEELAQ